MLVRAIAYESKPKLEKDKRRVLLIKQAMKAPARSQKMYRHD